MKLILQRFASFAFIGLILFFGILMLQKTIPYFSFRYDVDFLLTKQSVLHYSIWRWAFYTHIGFSLLVLIAGGFQFNKTIIYKTPKFHRFLGKIYVFLILFICAPSGLIMAFFANGGILAKTSFALTSVLWWYFTFTAFKNVLKKNIHSHLANMFRSYSLTLSAITLRLYVIILPHVILLHAKEMYTLVAWLSWVPNLLIAELLIRKQKLIN